MQFPPHPSIIDGAHAIHQTDIIMVTQLVLLGILPVIFFFLKSNEKRKKKWKLVKLKKKFQPGGGVVAAAFICMHAGWFFFFYDSHIPDGDGLESGIVNESCRGAEKSSSVGTEAEPATTTRQRNKRRKKRVVCGIRLPNGKSL